MTLPKQIQKTQTVFNAFIRLRDKDLPCISCGSWNVTDAGHYYSAGNYTGLRFTEINCNGQCKKCNCFLSGNLINYRQGLIARYGEDRVKLLEMTSTLHRFRKWSRFELEALYQHYSNEIKKLKAA